MDNEFEYKEEYAWLTNICLNVTDACNLACRYCFVEQHPHYMTFDIAKQAVHFILDNLEKKNKKFNKNERASITYFGGEPTLMWDEIIVPLTNYIKENNYPIDLNITTNGTLLNEIKIKFLKDNSIFPLLSIDGAEETQNYNRPCHSNNQNSFDLVIKNIPKLLEAFPNITFRSTIYAPTAHHTFQNYVFALEQGFQNIFMMPDARNEWTEEQKYILKNELGKIFSLIDWFYSNSIEPIGFSTIDDAYKNMLKHDLQVYYNYIPELNIQRSFVRCGMGTTFGSIGYDGSIFGCQEQTSKTKNNIFYLGNIFNNGIEQTRHIKLLKAYNKTFISECENNDYCNQCSLRQVCYGFNCPSSSYDLSNNFAISKEITCLWHQWIFNNAILLNNKMVQENNQLFKYYLENTCQFNSKLKKEE